MHEIVAEETPTKILTLPAKLPIFRTRDSSLPLNPYSTVFTRHTGQQMICKCAYYGKNNILMNCTVISLTSGQTWAKIHGDSEVSVYSGELRAESTDVKRAIMFFSLSISSVSVTNPNANSPKSCPARTGFSLYHLHTGMVLCFEATPPPPCHVIKRSAKI